MHTRIRVGLIRVLTTHEREKLNAHGKLLEKVYPALTVHSVCIPDQPAGIYDRATEERAIPGVITCGKQLADSGCNAIVVSCANDPGVAQLRTTLSIPIIGAGSAAACVARSLADRVGVIGITDSPPPVIKDILGSSLVAAKRPAGVATTLDLTGGRMLEATTLVAVQLREAGARALVLACTGFSTMQIVQPLQETVRIPVIDPILAAGCIVLEATGRSYRA